MEKEKIFSFKLFALIFFLHVIFEVTRGVAIAPASNVTQCGNLTCLHNAKCRNNSQGNQYCMCKAGYAGHTCNNDFDECSIGNPCLHRGTCQNSIGSYRCQCLDGWLGSDRHCDIKDNATTIRNCMPGWIGEWCQDQCLNDSMCRPTEMCIRRGRGLRCVCAPGWIGLNCSVDKDECLQHPCSNDTFCANTPGSYECNCFPGMTGANCDTDIDECIRNPCKHSSTCVNKKGYFNCTCAEGWQGHHCENDINECESNPCNSSYICEDNPGSFSCLLKQRSTDKDTTTIYIIIGAVLGSILMVCSIVTWLGILKYKCKEGHNKRMIQVEEHVPEKKIDLENEEERQYKRKPKPTQQLFMNKNWVH